MHRGPSPTLRRPTPSPAAIIPAGGRARRLGGTAKPLLQDGSGTPLITRLLDDLLGFGLRAEDIVVVGPAAQLDPVWDVSAPRFDRIRRTQEDPPFGGPAAAANAGLETLLSTAPAPEFVLLLGADMPQLARGLPVLLDAAVRSPASEAWIGRTGPDPGRTEHLFALHRTESLRRRLSELDPDGLPLRRLTEGLITTPVPLPEGAAADVDTWAAAAGFGLSAPPDHSPGG
ncbi:MAG: NTP transferase domain-containing protein [Nesterenkonia sp.]|nr:NTP transferase domain-containing protein [Nesterenkonia sp.]